MSALVLSVVKRMKRRRINVFSCRGNKVLQKDEHVSMEGCSDSSDAG